VRRKRAWWIPYAYVLCVLIEAGAIYLNVLTYRKWKASQQPQQAEVVAPSAPISMPRPAVPYTVESEAPADVSESDESQTDPQQGPEERPAYSIEWSEKKAQHK
jgi:hypothetical protein